MTLKVLAARRGLVALDKAAGLPTEPAPGFEADLLSRAAILLGLPARSLHAVNRLDVPVSGVVIVATDAAARSEAARIVADHRMRRRYLGLVARPFEPPTGCLSGAIGRSAAGSRVGGRDARPATTGYATVRSLDAATLTAFEPRTGRTHQIRVHAADARHPLLFDRRYGGARRLTRPDGGVVTADGLALHAARFELPLADGPWTVVAPPPARLVEPWRAVGGDDADWEAALAVAVPPCEAGAGP